MVVCAVPSMLEVRVTLNWDAHKHFVSPVFILFLILLASSVNSLYLKHGTKFYKNAGSLETGWALQTGRVDYMLIGQAPVLHMITFYLSVRSVFLMDVCTYVM